MLIDEGYEEESDLNESKSLIQTRKKESTKTVDEAHFLLFAVIIACYPKWEKGLEF